MSAPPVAYSDAALCFDAFSEEERASLFAYGRRALEVMFSGFWKLTSEENDRLARNYEAPPGHPAFGDKELLRGLLTAFRGLHAPNEPGSFDNVCRVLHASARRRDTPQARQVQAWITELRTRKKRALKLEGWEGHSPGVTDGLPVQTTPAELVADFMHGEHLHQEADRATRLSRWPRAALPLRNILCFLTLADLREVYLEPLAVVSQALSADREGRPLGALAQAMLRRTPPAEN
jgi:hypothetical protein